jgi:CheY-like chemotaxis protein
MMMDSKKKTTILIVDDSNLNRQILVDFLETKDFDIKEAVDGKQGLEMIQSEKPDIVLLDLIMPVMDGFETMENLIKMGISVPIIVITAYIKENTYVRCKELGAAGFLNKPVKMHELYNIISGILDNRNK